MDSYEVLPNGQVLKVYEIGTNEVKEHYDMFYHVKLTTDKTVITANDIDKATVTARVFDYLDNPVSYSGELSFDVEGEVFSLPATNGELSIEISSDYENQIDVAAWISNARAGGCIINAKEINP